MLETNLSNEDMNTIKAYIEDGRLVETPHYEYSNLRIVSYGPRTVSGHHWDKYTLSLRSAVIDFDNNKIVSQGFDRMFNFDEKAMYDVDQWLAIEKVDGELVHVFNYEGDVLVHSRKSWGSRTVMKARALLESVYKDSLQELFEWYPHATLIFELVYKDNRVIVDYQGKEVMYVLGARNLGAEKVEWNLGTPQIGKFESPSVTVLTGNVATLQEQVDKLSDAEGYIVYPYSFVDGIKTPFKLKTSWYKECARALGIISPKRLHTMYFIGTDEDQANTAAALAGREVALSIFNDTMKQYTFMTRVTLGLLEEIMREIISQGIERKDIMSYLRQDNRDWLSPLVFYILGSEYADLDWEGTDVIREPNEELKRILGKLINVAEFEWRFRGGGTT